MLVLLLIPALHADTCTGGYADPVNVGAVADSPITEASGLARAWYREGVWFTHNDAGGKTEIYAFRLDGTFVETHAAPAAAFVDWEDMSGGPCPDPADGHCLFVGDIGDNGATRHSVHVWVVKEPLAGETAQVVADMEGVYPDTPFNAETLFVHPKTGLVYVVTKSADSVSYVYRFPATVTGTQTLEYVTTLDFASYGPGSVSTTGGDWDESGDRVVIRTYSAAYEWVTDPCNPDGHWAAPPTVIRTTDQHGEAIAYDGEGNLVTVCEGVPMEMWQIACQGVTPGGDDCADTASPEAPGDTSASDTQGGDTGCSGDPEPGQGLDPTERHFPLGSDSTQKPVAGGGGCGCGTAGSASWRGLGLLLAGMGWIRRRRVG